MSHVMATVAEQLRAGREAMKLDVYQVAEITKIRTDHIRALESGDYDTFVAPVYIRGFVRTYAGLLKLDLAKIMADLTAELGRTEKFAEPPSLTNQPKGWLDSLMLLLSRLDWRIVAGVLAVTLVGLLAVAGYRLWYSHHHSDPLRKLGSPIYPQPAVTSNDFLPLPAPGGK
jgi:cytoskeletal protein RodZ